MPTLHVSSFQADKALREPPTKTADALTLGFREQTAAVSVGINALIERAAAEGTSIVIEGRTSSRILRDGCARRAHPRGARSSSGSTTKSRHRSHFAAREDAVAARPATRYVEGFEGIRRLQRYVKSQALAHWRAGDPATTASISRSPR